MHHALFRLGRSLALLLLSTCVALAARADTAQNAFVIVEGEGVVRLDGRNFAAGADGEVTIRAQPGWTLLSPSRVRVSQGQSPRYRVKSVSGEEDGQGDVWSTKTERVLRHLSDPEIFAAFSAGGPYVYAAPAEGAEVSVSGSAEPAKLGNHCWEITTISYRNGQIVDKKTEFSPPFTLPLDRWKWTWIPGKPGETNAPAFVSEPVLLPKGEYTASGVAEAWNSECEACRATASFKTNVLVSLLTVSCNPWIGQDRTGDPAAPYTSPKVTATATLDPKNPDVKKVEWIHTEKCDKSDAKDWTIELWTTDRETASDAYLGESVSASVAGATATTNFTIVRVDVILQGLNETDEETKGADIPLSEQMADPSTGNIDRWTATCTPMLPPEEEISVTSTIPNDLQSNPSKGVRKAATKIQTSTERSGYLVGSEPSKELRDRSLAAEHKNSGAKDKTSYTVSELKIKYEGEFDTGTLNSLFVGEKVDLLAVFMPGERLPVGSWEIPGETVKNWEGTTEKSILTPFLEEDKKKAHVQFYWISAAEECICSFSAKKPVLRCDILFHISRPEVPVEVKIGVIQITHEDPWDETSGLSLALGGKTGEGMIIMAQDPPSGKLHWAQLCSFERRFALDNGDSYRLQEGNAHDGPFPYGSTEKHLGGRILMDSPSVPLTDEMTFHSANDSFHDFLLFRSSKSESIYIPLKEGTWGWSATARKSGEEWELEAQSVTAPIFHDTNRFPSWNHSYFPGSKEIEKEEN